MKNKKKDIRFHLMLSMEESDLLKKTAKQRKISASELIRDSVKAVLLKKNNYSRLAALKNLMNMNL